MSEEFCEVEVSRINRPKIDASKIDQDVLNLVSKMNLSELPPEIDHEPGTILIKCRTCKRLKSIDEFYKNKRNKKHGRHTHCILCSNKENKEYKKTPEGKASVRKKHLKMYYKIDQAEYEKMLADQNGVCAICEGYELGRHGVLYVDHDHDTGKVRGLLCNKHNAGIGHFGHDPALLRKAADYIEKHLLSEAKAPE